MIEPATDRGRRLAALSRRLAYLHTELADQPEDLRREQLHDEVQRAVSSLQPPEREPFLRDLLELFADELGGGGPAPAPRPVPAKGPASPLEMAQSLAAAGLSDDEREQVIGVLRGAGLAPAAARPSGGGGVSTAAEKEVRRAVGLGADDPIDAERTALAAAMLAEFALKIEPWACTYWSNLAPDARNRVGQAVTKSLAKFVAGGEGGSKEALAKDLYRLRALISLLMRGVSEAGKHFARDHLSRYSVAEVAKAAGKGTLMESQDVKSWKQYVKLMEGVDEEAIEARMCQLVAKDVDAGLSQVIQ